MKMAYFTLGYKLLDNSGWSSAAKLQPNEKVGRKSTHAKAFLDCSVTTLQLFLHRRSISYAPTCCERRRSAHDPGL
jgi:hypothetical protein